MHIKQATTADIEWINQQYDNVGFRHSNLQNEIIAIAYLGDERAGIGRLQRFIENTSELGGIYVPDKHRGQGIAAAIVKFLLTADESVTTIYCIPFVHLTAFYASYDFVLDPAPSDAPLEIQEKLQWCGDTYSQETQLYILQR